MEQFSMYKKLLKALALYVTYVRRLNEIAISTGVNSQRQITDIKLLLIHFSDALLAEEKKFIDSIFDEPFNIPCKCKSEYEAIGIKFWLYHN